jgi:tripartite-type tricarboxylate transporter receptor subunit TctC
VGNLFYASPERLMRRLIAIACALMFGLASASAQTFPSKPLTLVVPFPPGGLTDVVGRIMAEGMRGPLGQPVVVENVSGATGSIGSARVARATPDGYTLVLGIWNTHVANGAIYKLDYDLVKDFAPVAFIGDAPLLFSVRKGVPANNVQELVAWLKANPGKATTGSAGHGSPGHLLSTMLRSTTQTQFEIVPYKGAGPLLQDYIAGQLDMIFIFPPPALPHIGSGAIKPLAITGAKRMALLPDVPTMDEAGISGLQFSLWAGLFAPRGTPKDVVETLSRAAQRALADKGTRDKLAAQGVEIAPPERQTAEALAALQKAEIDRWWPIIRDAGIKPN